MNSAVRRPTFRNLLIVFVTVNLILLGVRLWPWPAAAQLGGDSTTALDPAISLGIYVIMAFWIGNTRSEQGRKSLSHAATLGAIAGAVLVALVAVASKPAIEGWSRHVKLQTLLIAIAVLLWGAAAFRARRQGRTQGSAVICAAWSAMVSSLIGCTALLAETFSTMSPDRTLDPWKEYQGLAIGPESTQALVHTLNAATAFLLVGPILGCIAGAVLGGLVKPRKA